MRTTSVSLWSTMTGTRASARICSPTAEVTEAMAAWSSARLVV
jgi:hypothetical protein